ncbi:MAG: hypothetical protein R3Y59_08970 [bacterium]
MNRFKKHIIQFINHNNVICLILILLSSNKLKKRYFSSNKRAAHNNKKMIIVMCDNKIGLGGFSDRLRGIVSTYLLAKELNCDFKIHFNDPFDLDNVLLPNNVNWMIEESDISYNSNDSTVLVLKNMWFNSGESRKKAYLKLLNQSYKQIHVYSNDIVAHKSGQYHKLFNELFTLNPKFCEELQEHINCLGEKYISVASRFGVTLGDFEDCCGVPLSNDEQKELLEKCKSQIEFIHKAEPSKRILITSDSKKYIDYIRKELDYTYSQDGERLHFTKIKSNDFAPHKNSLIDFFLLSKSERIIQLKSKEMYGGAFSKSASLINNIPFEQKEF